MNCSTFAQQVDAWLDDELAPDIAAACHAHAADCAECRAMYAALQRLRGQIGDTYASLAPAPDFAERAMSRLEERLARQRGMWEKRASLAWLVVAAAMLVGLTVTPFGAVLLTMARIAWKLAPVVGHLLSSALFSVPFALGGVIALAVVMLIVSYASLRHFAASAESA